MAGTDAFQVESVVTEALPNGTYRVELANGHRLLAFVAGKARQNFERLAAGDTVKVAIDALRFVEGHYGRTKKI
jgi:translation initiation factor IF-1